MSAQAGWYPDPGGGQGLFRYWDGRAWSAATSPHPSAPPPTRGLVGAASEPGRSAATSGGNQPYGSSGGQSGGPYGSGQTSGAYARYQQTEKKKSPVGWWIAGIALVVVIVVVAVIAIRAVTGGTGLTGVPGGQGSQEVCPREVSQSPTEPGNLPADGRVHGGPVSYPLLGPPWEAPKSDPRVPFGSDVQEQEVPVEENYQPGESWVASVLVAELQAGDGFFTPEQGSQIVVKCILGRYYSDAAVNSDVTVNQKATIDGHEAWIVVKASFDIKGLQTKGELLIVAIVSAGATSGLYYASIPDTRPELVAPARQALKELKVDG